MLESRCYKALNSSNLDCHVGFLHEMQYGGKAPMVYDLQEPYRWIVDIAVINGLENKIFAKNDFIRTESYVIRLKTKGIEKLMELLNTQFAIKVKYKNQNWQWSSIIDLKAQELANYLLGKRKDIDFNSPLYKLDRIDNKELREKILAISYSDWKELGYSKGSLHQLKQKAKSNKPFKVYGKLKEKVENV